MEVPADQVEVDQPQTTSIDPSQVEVDQPAVPAEHVEVDQPMESNPALAGTEGVLRGLTGGLSDVAFKGARSLAEKYSDDPDFWAPKTEEVANREDTAAGHTGEVAGTVGGFMTGAGLPGLVSKGAGLLPEATSVLGKIGSAVIKSAIEGSALQTTDELSKSLLGQGDPETPVSSALAHIGAAGLISGLTGGVFNATGQGATRALSAIENAKIGTRAADMLAGMGAAAKAHEAGIPEKEAEKFVTDYMKNAAPGEEFNYNKFKPGVKAYYSGIKTAVNKVADATVNAGAAGLGFKIGGVPGAIAASRLSNKYAVPIVEKILDRPLIGITKYARPVIMNALAKGQTSGLFNALNYATKAAKGAKAINEGIEAVFKGTGQQAVNYVASERDKQKIMDHIDNGGSNKEMQDSLQEVPPEQVETDQPGFAKGGMVEDNDAGSLANLYPDQNMMLSAAKNRMSNYLGSLKPQKNQQKLAYDRAPDQQQQEKTYKNAVEMAAAPLSILKHIKDGTLQLEHIKHINSLYPELTSHLQKKLTARIMQSQLAEEAPSGKTKISMAMFLGSPLETYMTPQGIMAAQSTFLPKAPPQMPPAKNKKGTSNLGKSNNSYKTQAQAAESDRSSRE